MSPPSLDPSVEKLEQRIPVEVIETTTRARTRGEASPGNAGNAERKRSTTGDAEPTKSEPARYILFKLFGRGAFDAHGVPVGRAAEWAHFVYAQVGHARGDKYILRKLCEFAGDVTADYVAGKVHKPGPAFEGLVKNFWLQRNAKAGVA